VLWAARAITPQSRSIYELLLQLLVSRHLGHVHMLVAVTWRRIDAASRSLKECAGRECFELQPNVKVYKLASPIQWQAAIQ
jgi:hypothetical protein